MSKINITIIIYVFGLIIEALVPDIWRAKTSPKALLGASWTAIFAIAFFYDEKKINFL